jgi:translation initiation factor IF-1
MASEDLIEVEGNITDVYPGGVFQVTLDDGRAVQVHLGGKMRMHQIRVVLGDRVTVGLSPYDLTRGRIVFRVK